MGNVGTGFSMSLDGFVAGPNDEVDHVFAWMYQGSSDLTLQSGGEDLDLKVTSEGADIFEQATAMNGALVAGRRLFDITNGWGGKHPIGVPVVVVTHSIPTEWIKEHPDAPFTFVTDGVESAIKKAKEIAGDKNVVIASPKILQQVIQLGLLDAIHIDLAPVLLGEGIRLFEHLGTQPIELEIASVTPDVGVTHLDYRVVK